MSMPVGSGGRPAGRDNGLPHAPRYVPLLEVDPPLATQVLDLLHDAGVTALAEPLGTPPGPFPGATEPKPPAERIHVDASLLALARAVVGGALPGLRAQFLADAAHREDADTMRDADVETEFARIVAGLRSPDPAAPVPPWPVQEDLDDPAGRPPLSARLIRHDDPASAGAGPDARALDTAPDSPEDHFVPPPPPPLPHVDPVTRLAWAAILGGPALLLAATILGIGVQPWLASLAMLGVIAGFVTLVARMRDKAPHDDGWDDGAVV